MTIPNITFIKITNFCGIDKTTEFVFNDNPKRHVVSNLFEINGICGSGKTSFVNAFRFISECMWSDMPFIAFTSKRNKNNAQDSVTEFELGMYIDNSIYRYTIVVNFGISEIKSEKLEKFDDTVQQWITIFNRIRNDTDATTVCLRMYTMQQQLFDGDEDIKLRMLSEIVGPDKTFLHVAFDYIERTAAPCTLNNTWKHIYNVGNCLKYKLIAPADLLSVPLNVKLVCSDKFIRMIQAFGFSEIHGITTDGKPDTTTINHYGKWVDNFRNIPESTQKFIELMNVVYSYPNCTIVIDDLDELFHPVLTNKLLASLKEYYSGYVIYTTRRNIDFTENVKLK